MCIEHAMTCKCGSNRASFNFRDELMPVEIIDGLYCPICSSGVDYQKETMLRDNGWIIQYDMDVAKFMAGKLPASKITPEFLFDEGYCTWRGVYPMDHIDSIKEREELINLSKINKKKYLEEFKKWGINRMKQLAQEGWRKAAPEN
jgi:ABC-type amino acid transport substrate-binding protein